MWGLSQSLILGAGIGRENLAIFRSTSRSLIKKLLVARLKEKREQWDII